jgi:Uma2 family endonuclease
VTADCGSSYAGLDGLLLAIEVVSPDSEAIDRVIKKDEYASAGVPRYWIVDCDVSDTVYPYRLHGIEDEAERDPRALAWVLNGPVPELG